MPGLGTVIDQNANSVTIIERGGGQRTIARATAERLGLVPSMGQAPDMSPTPDITAQQLGEPATITNAPEPVLGQEAMMPEADFTFEPDDLSQPAPEIEEHQTPSALARSLNQQRRDLSQPLAEPPEREHSAPPRTLRRPRDHIAAAAEAAERAQDSRLREAELEARGIERIGQSLDRQTQQMEAQEARRREEIEKTNQRRQELMEEHDSKRRELESSNIDSNRLIRSMSTGQSIMAVIAGGLVAAGTGNAANASEMINRLVDRDVHDQLANLENKRHGLSAIERKIQGTYERANSINGEYAQRSAATKSILKNRIEKIKASTQSDVVRRGAEALNAELESSIQGDMANFAMSTEQWEFQKRMARMSAMGPPVEQGPEFTEEEINQIGAIMDPLTRQMVVADPSAMDEDQRKRVVRAPDGRIVALATSADGAEDAMENARRWRTADVAVRNYRQALADAGSAARGGKGGSETNKRLKQLKESAAQALATARVSGDPPTAAIKDERERLPDRDSWSWGRSGSATDELDIVIEDINGQVRGVLQDAGVVDESVLGGFTSMGQPERRGTDDADFETLSPTEVGNRMQAIDGINLGDRSVAFDPELRDQLIPSLADTDDERVLGMVKDSLGMMDSRIKGFLTMGRDNMGAADREQYLRLRQSIRDTRNRVEERLAGPPEPEPRQRRDLSGGRQPFRGGSR